MAIRRVLFWWSTDPNDDGQWNIGHDSDWAGHDWYRSRNKAAAIELNLLSKAKRQTDGLCSPPACLVPDVITAHHFHRGLSEWFVVVKQNKWCKYIIWRFFLKVVRDFLSPRDMEIDAKLVVIWLLQGHGGNKLMDVVVKTNQFDGNVQ